MKKYVKLYEEFINEYANLEVKESYQRTSKINTVEKFMKASKLKVGSASIKDLLQFIYDNFEDITGEKYQEPWDFIGNDFIADIVSTYKYGEEVVDQWKSMFEGNLFEARGFTMKEIREKAIEMFSSMGIKFPTEEQIADGIENVRQLISKYKLGTILESVNEANAPIKDLQKNMPDHVEGWAKYVAQHANGEWWYYEDYPVLVKNVGWKSHDRDGYQMGSNIKTNARGWENSVQKLKESVNLAESHVKMYEDFAVYEAEAAQGKQPVNIMVGRFQPFHNGHYLACKELHEANGNPVVLVTVRGSGTSGKGTAFTEATMDKMMKDVIKKSGFIIDHVEIKFVAFDTQLFPALRPKYEPVLMGAGDDRIDTYERQTQSMRVKHENKLNIREDFAIHLTGRYGSGTAVRQAITDRDQKEFENTMPKFLWDYWDILSKEMGMNESMAEPLFPDVLKIKKDIKITSNANNERDVLPAGEYKSTGKEFDGMHIYQSKGKNWFLWPEDMDIINDMNESMNEGLDTVVVTSMELDNGLNDLDVISQYLKKNGVKHIIDGQGQLKVDKKEYDIVKSYLKSERYVKESVEDYRDLSNPGTAEFVKLVKQVKSQYSKMFDIDINDSDVVIVTGSGDEIRIVDKSSIKKISAELESDNLPKGYVNSRDYAYNEIDKVFKTIDTWLKKYTWLTESETVEDTKVEGPKEDAIDRIARTCDDCKKDLAKTGASIEKLKTAIENGAKDPKAFESLAQLVKIHESLIKELMVLEGKVPVNKEK